MTNGNVCRIWGTPTGRHIASVERNTNVVSDSPRAGGTYEISLEARAPLRRMDDGEKARVTTWVVDQHLHGGLMPLITAEVVNRARDSSPLSVAKRADRLLQLIARKSIRVGEEVWILAMKAGEHDTGDDKVPQPTQNLWEALAWSESVDDREIGYLANYLNARGWLEYPYEKNRYIMVVSIDGYYRLEAQATKSLGEQSFVAMWFNDETNDAYDHGIRPAIEDAGYTAMRIDRKEHINKIDDEIVAEIRRSRFLVADYTQGSTGARGGVYWEDGFASGLGLKVIRTCRKDCMDKVALDTRQYYHILWETPEELRTALKTSILANIGEGPITPSGATRAQISKPVPSP